MGTISLPVEKKMPEQELYQTELDECGLMMAAFDAGCWLVPDLNYNAPAEQRILTLGEFQQVRSSERHFSLSMTLIFWLRLASEG